MGEYDDRQRGGRGYHNNNNRKRRFRADEDDYNNHRQQRRRYEEPDHVKIRRQILSLAESHVKRPEDEVIQVAKLVADTVDNEKAQETFLNTVVELVFEQPFKIPFVAAVVLAASTHEADVVSPVLARLKDIGQTALNKGSWSELKLALRFLAGLQGLFEGDGIFPFLDELFDKAVELQTASSEDALGLELVKMIQLALPYILASTSPESNNAALASALLEKTDVIASTPHPLEALVNPYPGNRDKESTSFIGLLQKQLQNECNQQWPLKCVPRPSKEVDVSLITRKHPFPDFHPPEVMNPGPKSLFPDVFFSVYADSSVETVPPTDNIASCLLRDSLTDTINFLDFNRNATAKFLIDLDSYFAPNTFVKRATQFDKLKDIPEGQSTWKPEDVAVDAVFSQLFQLPDPGHKLVYYHSVLTEMCQVAPAAIAPSLGRAIRFLYKNIETMDLELEYRFMDWFAHHLSNFGFTWKWVEWVDDVELPDVHPKKAFMVGALEKEVRLSFASRIRDTLPAPYQPLIPKAKDQDVPDFKYHDPQLPFSEQGRSLRTLIHKKAPDEEVQAILDDITSQATASALPDPNLPAIDAFMTSICSIGAKSLSHVLSCIERSKDRLMLFGGTAPQNRRQIISSVMAFWTHQPGVGINIVDKLLNYTILTPLSVVEWVLSQPPTSGNIGGAQVLCLPHLFEMVAATLYKVTNRVRQIIAARDDPSLPTPQVLMLQETLMRERAEEVTLFGVVEDALVSFASGSKDEMLDGDVDEEKMALLKAWGERWLTVFRRKFAVEKTFVEEKIRNVPEGRPEKMGEAVDQNGEMAVDRQADDLRNGNGLMADDEAVADDLDDQAV